MAVIVTCVHIYL